MVGVGTVMSWSTETLSVKWRVRVTEVDILFTKPKQMEIRDELEILK